MAAPCKRSVIFPQGRPFLGKLVQRLEEEDETGRPCKHPEDQLPPVHPGIVTLTNPPSWVAFAAYVAIGFGTLSGGWRIIKTMGSKITKLQPLGGACAETGAGLAVLFASQLGVVVSTTHTITGAIVGVGSTRRLSAVKWGVAGRIVWAWIITIPAAAGIAALTYGLISLFR